MEFLLYLSPSGNQIYQTLKNKINFAENAPICRKHDIYGWYNSKTKTITFCTDTIKKGDNVSYFINETLYHESVHVAQSCRSNTLVPLGLSSINLSSTKQSHLKKSVSMSGSSVYKIEKEAFYLEDKPEKIRHYLKKFCF
jgi:hypothetical protein